MKKQPRQSTKQRTTVREIKVKKDYAGIEASPYREYLVNKGDYNQEHEANEVVEANPDMLEDKESLWFQDPNAADPDKMELVRKEWSKLTDRQKEILQLCGYEGRTLENAAAKLGVSRGTVQKILERLRARFNRCLTKEVKAGIK